MLQHPNDDRRWAAMMAAFGVNRRPGTFTTMPHGAHTCPRVRFSGRGWALAADWPSWRGALYVQFLPKYDNPSPPDHRRHECVASASRNDDHVNEFWLENRALAGGLTILQKLAGFVAPR
jgi:hypothetical protein